MNIFDNYLLLINKLIIDNKNNLKIENLDYIKNINLEVPPEHFDYDLSTNISLVLSKINNLNPKNLANEIKKIMEENITHFEKVDVAGPGFINIKLSKTGIISIIKNILKNKETYGSKESNETYNIEFVSANVQQNKLVYEDELKRALDEDGQRTSTFIAPQSFYPTGI